MSAATEGPLDLALVVPVYNEQECIVAVLQEWRQAMAACVRRFCILVIDDGSTDQTPERLKSLDWPELKVHRHANRGHGQSCIVGYRLAAETEAAYVFQIDSDGQCDPTEFSTLWSRRNEAVAIYGRRTRRDDGLARRVITKCLRYVLKFQLHTRLNDTNVPYRLYKTDVAAEVAARVPITFDLANIAMALLMEPLGFVEIPIHFRDRMGGHPSVKWLGFAKKAKRLMNDLHDLPHA